jgi:hypothetical protein
MHAGAQDPLDAGNRGLPVSALVKYGQLWRVAALLLLLIAMFGPWTYERVDMPPSAPCTAPNVQAAGDPYCGIPLPVFLELLGLFRLGAALWGGALSLNQWASLTLLPFLLVLPIVMLSALMLRRRTVRRQTLFLIAWALAALAGAGYFYRGDYRPYAPPWGMLLYIAVALAALLLELLWLRTMPPTTRRPPPNHSLRQDESPLSDP